MTTDQIAKANAELRHKSALDRVTLGDGARRSRRFNVRIESRPGISCVASQWTLKRAQARVPLAPGAGHSISRVSLTPGLSRVGCAVNEANGFNRFPRAIALKPLKRLDRYPHFFTGLKPGANERPGGNSRTVRLVCDASIKPEFR